MPYYIQYDKTFGHAIGHPVFTAQVEGMQCTVCMHIAHMIINIIGV